MGAIRLQLKFGKMVSYWSNEHGEGVKANGETDEMCRQVDYSWLDGSVSANNLEDVEQSVKNYLEKNNMPSDYLAIMDDGHLSFNAVEDGGGNIIISKKEQDELEKDGKQLYICDYDIFVNILAEPTKDQLSILFPSAEKMF